MRVLMAKVILLSLHWLKCMSSSKKLVRIHYPSVTTLSCSINESKNTEIGFDNKLSIEKRITSFYASMPITSDVLIAANCSSIVKLSWIEGCKILPLCGDSQSGSKVALKGGDKWRQNWTNASSCPNMKDPMQTVEDIGCCCEHYTLSILLAGKMRHLVKTHPPWVLPLVVLLLATVSSSHTRVRHVSRPCLKREGNLYTESFQFNYMNKSKPHIIFLPM